MGRYVAILVRSLSIVILTAFVARAEPAVWRLAVIGDQQFAVNAEDDKDWIDRFTSQTKWLAANAAAINLRMVCQIGDIVEHSKNNDEWTAALAGMQILDSAPNADGGTGIPWHVAYGNHEVIGGTKSPKEDLAGPGPSATYRRFFGTDGGKHRYSNQPQFQGVSSNDLNTWHVIKSSAAADARSYLMLNLEIDVPGNKTGTNFDAIAWAQSVLDDHPGMPTIVTTHVFEGSKHGPPKNPYFKGFGHNSQLEIFDKLIKGNSQIFMVLSGHTSEDTHQIKQNARGEPVLQMVTDYTKWLGQAGDGFFRLITIDESAGKVQIKTYSALLNKHRTDENSQFEFTVDFKKRFTPAPGGRSTNRPAAR